MKRFRLFTLTSIFFILFCNAAWAERLAVSGPFAYIRSGPGAKYDIIGKVERYYPILVIEKSEEWIHFRNYENDVGWIQRALLSEIPTVITKSKKCNIRSGPGTFHKILATIGKGLPFRVIKRKGNWLNIQHTDGFEGWIHKRLVW